MDMNDKFQKQLSYGTAQGLVTSARVIQHKSCPWKELQCLCMPYKRVISSMDWTSVEQEMNMRKVCSISAHKSSKKTTRTISEKQKRPEYCNLKSRHNDGTVTWCCGLNPDWSDLVGVETLEKGDVICKLCVKKFHIRGKNFNKYI